MKNEIYKYVTSISKSLYSVYIDKLANIFNECNDTYHGTIKMKPIDVKSSTYIDLVVENNDKDSEFNVGDHVRIPKYKKHFCKRLCSKFV